MFDATVTTCAVEGDYLFLPYQCRWTEDQSDVRVCVKARQIGITWATGLDELFNAAEGLWDVLYVAYDMDIGYQFIHDVSQWAVKFQALEGVDTRDPFYTDERDLCAGSIRLKSGKRITALASTPRKFRGRRGCVIIDEAAFHPDVDAVLQAALKVPTWGGRTIIISTHYGVENPFNLLVNRIRSGELSYSLHEITLDDALRDGLYKRICEVTGKSWTPEAEAEWRQEEIDRFPDSAAADEELFCLPRSSGNAYFDRESVTRCMDHDLPTIKLQPDLENEAALLQGEWAWLDSWLWNKVSPLVAKLDKYEAHYLGMDFARSGHLSVIAPVAMSRDNHRKVPFLVEMGKMPHEAQRRVLWYILDKLPRFSGACLDAGGNGSWLAEVTAAKYPVVQAVSITQPWYAEQIPALLKTVEAKEITLPFSRELQGDFDLFRFQNGIPRLPHTATKTRARGQARHGDGAMAIALAHQACLTHDDLSEYLSNVCSTRWT